MNATPILRRVSLYQLASLSAVAILALVFRPQALLSLLAGGLLMAVNFWLLRALGQKAFSGARAKMGYALLLAVKMVVVLGLMAFFVLVLRVDPLAFAVGLATLFVGLGIATLTQSAAHAPEATLADPSGTQG